MTRSRSDHEKSEAKTLAPYACASVHSRGRRHHEAPHPHRTEFQRDRDRIVHSRAFRRLEGKTQVFLNGTGDHYRTRLTHTMEVASITRAIARALALNEDLAETIALAHDLGHPPFGHAGEASLNDAMRAHGGFEHNQQSLRVVEELELKYPEFNGLNLTFEVLDGLAKPHALRESTPPLLEARVADLADEIAYVCHDLDDGLEAGLLTDTDVAQQALWKRVEDRARQAYPRLEAERARSYVVRGLLDLLVEDAIEASGLALEKSPPASPDAARRSPTPLLTLSADIAQGLKELRHFLSRRLYHHPTVASVNQRTSLCLRQLFDLLVARPHLLPPPFAVRIKKEGEARATCDYLACLTDRHALHLYEKLIGGTPQLIDATALQQPVLF